MSPMGPPQQYVVKYNSYQLPGYAQSEDEPSNMEIASKYAPYVDGGLSEYTGLRNKKIRMGFKIWEPTWEECKNQYYLATTYLRSKKSGWAPLEIGYTDRYYLAMTTSVQRNKQVGKSSQVRILDYEVEWEALPWLQRTYALTISGTSTGTIDTDIIGRSILTHGGWTPATVKITGTNVTVSGFTATGDFTGFISVSGAVTNLVVDSFNFTAKIGSTNANDRMLWKDYQLWLGPGKTNFTIAGDAVTLVKISWNDRWY